MGDSGNVLGIVSNEDNLENCGKFPVLRQLLTKNSPGLFLLVKLKAEQTMLHVAQRVHFLSILLVVLCRS